MDKQRMKWTKEPPTEPGWYWVEAVRSQSSKRYRAVVDLGYLLAWVRCGCGCRVLQWAGPIQEPSE